MISNKTLTLLVYIMICIFKFAILNDSYYIIFYFTRISKINNQINEIKRQFYQSFQLKY